MPPAKELSNKFCTLRFHRESMRGLVQDYVIDFKELECDIEACVDMTSDLFVELMKHFEEDLVKARLIAEVNYLRMDDDDGNSDTEDESENYHFTSYAQEYVDDPLEFYQRHMQKIMSRMDSFHVNGSNLLLNKINHIHIAISRIKV